MDGFFLAHSRRRAEGVLRSARIGVNNLAEAFSTLGERTPIPEEFRDHNGACEQIGLICRLAYADLLKEAGQPTLIILDDALVHSDLERLESMTRILFDASGRHQIFLFTCHPKAWEDLGAAVRSMESLRAGVFA